MCRSLNGNFHHISGPNHQNYLLKAQLVQGKCTNVTNCEPKYKRTTSSIGVRCHQIIKYGIVIG